MTKNNFWNSELGLLTLNWMNNISLISWTGEGFTADTLTGSSPSFAGERECDFAEGDQGAR